MQIVLMFPGTEVIASLRKKNPKNKFFGSFDEKLSHKFTKFKHSDWLKSFE